MTNEPRLDLQIDYWNRVGPTKPFAHPVNLEQFRRWVSPTSKILDYGCGYGRALGILKSHGFTNLIGVDPSPAMIAAARRNVPSLSFQVLADYRKVDLPDSCVDAVLLFAVLTSVPADDGQLAIMSEITRLLRPNGLLYLSDMWLQTDARNIERYVEGDKKYATYGVFDLPEGVTVRHHDRVWIDRLTHQYEVMHIEDIKVETMNRHEATAFQWFGLKREI
jgi:SAM-dependent methyltransferase